MEVILLERVDKLGQMGDLVTVKPGYARNFLLPKGKALRATESNRKRFEDERAKLEAENLARKSEAEKVAAKMEGLSVVLVRAASEMGQLYGSASSRDIAEKISEVDISVNRNQIDLNTAIKTLGLFPVRVVLHPEVSVEVTVNIARSEDEAAEQQRLGRAIISDVAERERAEAAEAAQEAEERMAEMLDEGEDGDAAAEEAAAGAAKAKKAKPAAPAKGKAKAKAKSAKEDGDSAEGTVKAKKAKSAKKDAGSAEGAVKATKAKSAKKDADSAEGAVKAKKTKSAPSAKGKAKAKTKTKAKAKAAAKKAGGKE